MDISKRIKNAVAAFRKTNNEVGLGVDPSSFLKYGKSNMRATWSTPEITDADFYTGYGFAVINKRANRSVVLGKKYLYTQATESMIKDANDKGTRLTHPYLELIRDSTDFAERDFWYNISTYLDLEGIYYLMAVRTVSNGRVGNIQKFSLLNPYWIHPVKSQSGELGGYAESNPVYGERIIPKEMIIPIKLLNPFNPNDPYSLADAARDSQFTLKQANDYARESINGNLNSPGILSSSIELPDDQFDNFVSRVKNHGRGEPLFGNGAGTVSWVDMQTDLDKAALNDINSINRDTLLAISGLSKTGVGVEESGTGREVSRTQKDDFTENAVMPQIENIIDALNLDFRMYYPDIYKKTKYVISLDNPLETDRDAEQLDVEIRDAQFTLVQSLTAAGYPYDVASKFAKGEIDITDLGEPLDLQIEPPEGDGTAPIDDSEGDDANEGTIDPPVASTYKDKTFQAYEGYPIPVLQYLGDEATQISPLSERASIIYSNDIFMDMNAKKKTITISHIDEAGSSLIGVVDDTTFVKLGEFKNNADRPAILAKLNKRYKHQVVAVKNKIEFHQHETPEVIKNAAFDKKAQIETNLKDLITSAQSSEDSLFDWYIQQITLGNTDPHLEDKEKFINSLTLPFAVYFTLMFPVYAHYRNEVNAKELKVDDPMPITAITDNVKATIHNFAVNEATSHVNTLQKDLEKSLSEIRTKATDPDGIKMLFNEAYDKIRAQRSQTIANSAAAKIYNMSQYEADLQFLTRAGLVNQAYKELFSLTGDPCPFCASLIASSHAEPIPFSEAFASLGDTIQADGKSMTFTYEDIIAGNVHPNCYCAYKLIIKE